MIRIYMQRLIVFLFVWFLVLPGVLYPDALIIPKAMTASTIAEIYVSEESVRVELEIGGQDFAAFRNVLPDTAYEKMGFEPIPLETRLRRFLRQEWIVKSDGTQMKGVIQQILARKRVKRDEITGEPLPVQGEDAEVVIFLEILYRFVNRPQTISLTPPRDERGNATAHVGFIIYHRGLPVMDFRYLGTEEMLDLDWEDPWFSRFRNRNIRRQYDSPLSAFLYVDHFEVRKEIIVRPKDLQHWVDLGLEGKEIIMVDDQAALKERIADYLIARGHVLIDGRKIEPVLDRIHFVRRSLRQTRVIDPPEDLHVVSATLGVIFIYPISGLPQHVTMQWDLFSSKIQKVPAIATDEAGGLPSYVTPDDPVLEWQNFLKNPSTPGLVELPPPSKASLPLPLLSLLCVVIVIYIPVRYFRDSRTLPKFAILVFVAVVSGAILLWPYARISLPNPLSTSADVSESDARDILHGLLKNVYRAFDYRDDSVIYDILSRSATGDLLTQIYIETRKALELQNQGGARAKVKEVEMLSTATDNMNDEVGFTSLCTWNVVGSVGHWGHIHQRRNQYRAVLTVQAIEGVWKITDLELISEERL